MRQVKAKGSRRISFEQFLTGLAVVADSKKAALETIVSEVGRLHKPSRASILVVIHPILKQLGGSNPDRVIFYLKLSMRM